MKKLSTSAKTTEVDFVSDNIVTFYHQEPALAEDPFFQSLIDKISHASDDITEAIKRDVVLSRMEEADAVVDNSVRALKIIVKGYAAMPDEKISSSAQIVLQVINKFSLALLQKNYAEQSSNVEALLMDLKSEELKPHIDNLAMVGNAIGIVDEAQAGFKKAFDEYTTAVAENSKLASATEIRKELIALINAKLIVYLKSAVMMNPEKYGMYVDKLEEVIKGVNQNVRSRVGSRKKKKVE